MAIVTGAGSGIGRATAAALCMRGWRVYDFSRTNRAQTGVIHIACDVSRPEDAQSAVERVLKSAGRIDLLVNNAGFGISGAIEFTDTRDALRQMSVNLMGADNLVKCVLAPMRARGKGRIVNVSSVAALLPIPFQAWYSASKAAINAYTLALRNEVAPFGISVCAVLPGDIHTGFTNAREKGCAGDDIYGGRVSRAVSAMEHDEIRGMRAEAAGARIARIAQKPRVKPLNAIGAKYRAFCALSRVLPTRFVNWVVGRLYS